MRPGDEIYIDSYGDLQTMRAFEGGPIPFDKILWYAVEILGLAPEIREYFTAVIREMDVVYRDWVKEQQEKGKKKPGSSSSKPNAARPPRRGIRRPKRRR
jgi:hypothetical protein